MATTAEDLIRHHRFTVEEYRRMGETGIFHEDDRVELIEITDTSLPYDREVKLPLYARYGVPAVWLVDLQDNRLLLFSQPTEQGFKMMKTADIGRPIALPGIAGVRVNLAGLF